MDLAGYHGSARHRHAADCLFVWKVDLVKLDRRQEFDEVKERPLLGQCPCLPAVQLDPDERTRDVIRQLPRAERRTTSVTNTPPITRVSPGIGWKDIAPSTPAEGHLQFARLCSRPIADHRRCVSQSAQQTERQNSETPLRLRSRRSYASACISRYPSRDVGWRSVRTITRDPHIR